MRMINDYLTVTMPHEELTEKQNYDKLKFDFLVNRKDYKYKGEADGRSSFKEFYRENY